MEANVQQEAVASPLKVMRLDGRLLWLGNEGAVRGVHMRLVYISKEGIVLQCTDGGSVKEKVGALIRFRGARLRVVGVRTSYLSAKAR